MKSLWITLRAAFLQPKITPMVIALQAAVLAHAGYLFLKGQRHLFEDTLFISYVLASAYYWKCYARQKKMYYEKMSENSKNNHSH